eukprot:scaffold2125_cov126-Cylindrotheca_fusiformis.AAC.12
MFNPPPESRLRIFKGLKGPNGQQEHRVCLCNNEQSSSVDKDKQQQQQQQHHDAIPTSSSSSCLPVGTFHCRTYRGSSGKKWRVRNVAFFGPSNLALKGVGVSSEISDEVVKAHIVRGTYTTDDLLNAKDGCIVLNTLSTVAPRIKVTVLNHGDMKILMVNNVHVIIHDLEADNGIFHGVDGMILPGSFTPCYHSTMRGISAAGPSLFGNGMVVTAAMSAVAVVAASSWILMSL